MHSNYYQINVSLNSNNVTAFIIIILSQFFRLLRKCNVICIDACQGQCHIIEMSIFRPQKVIIDALSTALKLAESINNDNFRNNKLTDVTL